MPEINPFVNRSLYEYFFGMYGNDQRAGGAMNEIRDYLKNTPGAQDVFQKATGGIQALLTKQAENGLPELQALKNQAAQSIGRASAKNVRAMRENIDPTLLKTMGASAFNEIYANEEEALAQNEANFTRLNMASKENAIAQLLGIAGTNVNAMNSDRRYQLDIGSMAEGAREYNSQADLAGELDWGSIIGGLFQGAGAALGGL